MQASHDGSRIGLAAVGFSPADRLAAIAGQIGWRGLVLSDPDRRLYRRLGVGRAALWQVYSPGTLRLYARAIAAGHHLSRADEDTRQLGADAIVVDGTVTTLWRPQSPDDRPTATAVLAAAHEVLARRG
ncbi:MAG: AhpC/TSA family protein [Acidimicrobiales bacterium]